MTKLSLITVFSSYHLRATSVSLSACEFGSLSNKPAYMYTSIYLCMRINVCMCPYACMYSSFAQLKFEPCVHLKSPVSFMSNIATLTQNDSCYYPFRNCSCCSFLSTPSLVNLCRVRELPH